MQPHAQAARETGKRPSEKRWTSRAPTTIEAALEIMISVVMNNLRIFIHFKVIIPKGGGERGGRDGNYAPWPEFALFCYFPLVAAEERGEAEGERGRAFGN